MKAAQRFAAAAALLCALPTSIDALAKVETRYSDAVEDDASRGLSEVSITFEEECLHKHLDVCIEAINAELAARPDLFDYRTHLNFEVNKIREKTDEGYNYVSLRLNKDGLTVAGVLGDGMVWYPYEWCIPTEGTTMCYTIGPWDCDVGLPLSPEECCKMITDTVPSPDINGKRLECYNDYPVGSDHNPVDRSRVSIHTDAANIVVHVPRNE